MINKGRFYKVNHNLYMMCQHVYIKFTNTYDFEELSLIIMEYQENNLIKIT